LELVLDDNIGGEMRTAIVTITSTGGTANVKVSQYGDVEGIVADNSNADYIQTAATKKLGVGCNLIEFYDDPTVGLEYKRNSAFNIAALKALNNSGKIKYDGLISTTPRSKLEFKEAKMDSIVNKHDSLGVSVDIKISYAKFKFGLSGKYVGDEQLKDHALRLGYGADYPTLDAGISYADALAHYYNYQKELAKAAATRTETENVDDYRQNIVTTGLAKMINNVKAAVSSEKQSNIDGNIKKLINSYGTGIVIGSTLGGRITLDLYVDSLYISGTTALDSAQVTANLSAGLFTLDGNVTVSYLNKSVEVLQNSAYLVDIEGGDIKKAAEIIAALSKPTYNNKIPSLINDWAGSITNNVNPAQSNADLLDIDVIPIWELFDDYECQEAILSYLKRLYPNSKYIRKYENGEFDQAAKASDATKDSKSRIRFRK
jgi:hypothetical protein